MYIIGLMSGTSLDGVDAVLAHFGNERPSLVGKCYLPFPARLKDTLWQLQTPADNELHISQQAANALAEIYAEAITALLADTGFNVAQISAIGCHGQTIRHRPECGYTVQIGNAALLAELTDIHVVSDFRARDIAAGGQGAPLTPAFHAALFAHENISRVIVNIGGISNLTCLPIKQQTIIGFDCGPGNALMDYWVNRHLGQAYDTGGQWAAGGKVIPSLLANLLSEPFFQSLPPKSTGRDLFNPSWLAMYLAEYTHAAPQDIQATLLMLTARSIADAIGQYADGSEVYLCGGGAYNSALCEKLQTLLPHCKIATIQALGIAPDTVEAFAFAWLAYQTLQHQPGNLPAVTGARGLRILGNITFA